MKKLQRNALSRRMSGSQIAPSKKSMTTEQLSYYVELINMFAAEEVSISWVENFLVTYSNNNDMDSFQTRYETIKKWLVEKRATLEGGKFHLAIEMEIADMLHLLETVANKPVAIDLGFSKALT